MFFTTRLRHIPHLGLSLYVCGYVQFGITRLRKL